MIRRTPQTGDRINSAAVRQTRADLLPLPSFGRPPPLRHLLRSAHRQGPHPPAQQGLQFRQEAVAAQRPACVRPQPNPGYFLVRQSFRQFVPPRLGGDLLISAGQVQ
jgi:hypothetical protein